MALERRYCTAEVSFSALRNGGKRVLNRTRESFYHRLDECGGLSQILRGFAADCSPELGHDEFVDRITFRNRHSHQDNPMRA